jgi:hypothetical protein
MMIDSTVLPKLGEKSRVTLSGHRLRSQRSCCSLFLSHSLIYSCKLFYYQYITIDQERKWLRIHSQKPKSPRRLRSLLNRSQIHLFPGAFLLVASTLRHQSLCPLDPPHAPICSRRVCTHHPHLRRSIYRFKAACQSPVKSSITTTTTTIIITTGLINIMLAPISCLKLSQIILLLQKTNTPTKLIRKF